MAEATPYNLDAVRSDGFVDFYELLSLPQTASAGELQERIQDLYSEAQANRDHRNLNKRRDYQTLLEYLPQARIVLPDPAKRALYDDYAAQARAGSAPLDFSTFIGQLSGQVAGEDDVRVLGTADGRTTRTVPKTGASTTAAATTAVSTSGNAAGSARRQPQVPPGAQSGPPAAAIAAIVFVVAAAILFFAVKSLPIALVVAAVAAGVVWFVTQPKGGTPVGR